MATKVRKLIFKERASAATQALVMMFDLENFSKFFGQPDVQQYVPKYLNRIFDCIAVEIYGGKQYWDKDQSSLDPLLPPVHQKFLGDGALYIWTIGRREENYWHQMSVILLNRLWNLKKNFKKIVKTCLDDVPIVDIPQRIRFGITAGSVYKLTHKNKKETEYIGYCVNLASRLQKYCRKLGFIASARIRISQKMLDKHGYIKVTAKKLQGFPSEIVIVDKNEYNTLEIDVRNELFDQIK